METGDHDSIFRNTNKHSMMLISSAATFRPSIRKNKEGSIQSCFKTTQFIVPVELGFHLCYIKNPKFLSSQSNLFNVFCLKNKKLDRTCASRMRCMKLSITH